MSDVTGREDVIDVYTSRLRDGSLFYALGVALRDQYATYSRVFTAIARSIQFAR